MYNKNVLQIYGSLRHIQSFCLLRCDDFIFDLSPCTVRKGGGGVRPVEQ